MDNITSTTDDISDNTTNEFDTLVDNLKKWYARKQRAASDLSLISDPGSDDDSIYNIYSKYNSQKSINNPTIITETISNQKKTVTVPDQHVIIERQLLNSIIDDHHKTTEILYKILPSRVINELSSGNQVVPEEYESVTILFSDIVGMNL